MSYVLYNMYSMWLITRGYFIMSNIKKFTLASLIVATFSSAAIADQGHGKVSFTGAIIDAPCSISPDSVDQTVDMGQIANAALANGGRSTSRNFTIALENCSFGSPASKNKVEVLFTGNESTAIPGNLGIAGSASGASLALTDGAGEPIVLGTPTKEQTLQDGNNTLLFAAFLQGDGASSTVVEGEFTAVTDFTLSYN